MAVMFDAILNRTPAPVRQLNPDVSTGFERIMTRLLDKDRDSRYQTAAEVHDDLKRLEREGTVASSAAPVTERDTILLVDFTNTTGETIFDGTLTQALAVKLEESPYLNIASDDRVQHTLRLMGRPPDERLTPAVGREICQRQGIKAMVTGSIASLGSQYVITLTAVNCQNGDSIARAQGDAASREEVLSALGVATTRLRGKLGESLASIQRFDMPVEDVTTSSLDALKAYSLACSLRAAGKEREAVPQLKHAIDLDPDFALAHAILGFVYRNLGELSLRDHHVTQAYERRSRVTERERLFITGTYHKAVSGDLLKEFETLTLLQQTYPRYAPGFAMIGHYYDKLGQLDLAADVFRETVRLAPDASSLTTLAYAYINLNRLDEAKTVLEQVTAHTPEYTLFHYLRVQIAYFEHDDATKERELDWLTVHEPRSAFGIQAWAAGLEGKLREVRRFVAKLADLETRAGLLEGAALTWLSLAEIESACGAAEAARRDVAHALKLTAGRSVAHNAARILAMSGFHGEAQPLLDRCLNEYPPTHALAKALYIPAIYAALELTHANAAAAVETLQVAEPYETADYGVMYLKASAYLASDRPSDAAAEFQKLIDHAHRKSWYPRIALLGRARAVGRMGDSKGSRMMYEHFLTAWKDADSDLPILVAAREEYRRLE
jgi:tetratricopeptide (TPR) repeat protein